MESVAQETSPAPSAKGLKGVLTKARRGRKDKDNGSTLSVNGTDNSGSSSHGGIRSSIDSAVDKLKSHSAEDTGQKGEDDSEHGRIGKLLPGRIRKKRRKAPEATEQEKEEASRGRSIGEKPSNAATGNLGASDAGADNQSSLDNDGGSSLITYDSDPDS